MHLAKLGCGIAQAILACAFASAVRAGTQGGHDFPAVANTGAQAVSATVRAEGASLALQRQVIADGGGSSSGGAFRIDGTIGQADADPLHPATGGGFAISGGFWPGLVPIAPGADAIFANGYE